MKNKPLLSIIVPMFNEEHAIPLLAKELRQLSQNEVRIELVIINDGSKDKTSEVAKECNWPFHTTIIEFSRNYGHQAAILAGLRESKGDWVISMDADLQHPINLIPQMLQLARQGYDLVLTSRIDHHSVPFLKKLTASAFYTLLNRWAEVHVTENSSDFRLLSRKAVTALLALPEKRIFLRGLVEWIGFQTVVLPYQANERSAGKTKYSFKKMLKLSFHGITSFTTTPLYLSGITSLVLFTFAFLYALYVFYMRLFQGTVVSGWASVLLVNLIIGGFLSLFLGLIGAYIAAIYEEIKSRPQFIIDSKHILHKEE